MVLHEQVARIAVGLLHRDPKSHSGPDPVEEAGLTVVETCLETWLFDSVVKRYCRMPVGRSPQSVWPSDWKAYEVLLVDDAAEEFVLILDVAHTRLLRARAHHLPCRRCGASQRVGLTESDLGHLLRCVRG